MFVGEDVLLGEGRVLRGASQLLRTIVIAAASPSLTSQTYPLLWDLRRLCLACWKRICWRDL